MSYRTASMKNAFTKAATHNGFYTGSQNQAAPKQEILTGNLSSKEAAAKDITPQTKPTDGILNIFDILPPSSRSFSTSAKANDDTPRRTTNLHDLMGMPKIKYSTPEGWN